MEEEKKKSEIPNAHAWQNDDSKVGIFFYACHENYKSYMGEKSDRIKLKLYAVYKQATVGDCNEDKPYDKIKREKWEEWRKFKGMTKVAAMRRYITLLRQLDPQLIVVEINEAPPSGFPETSMGGPICARCNCKAGCLQPLLGSDPKSTPLEHTLQNDQRLLSYDGLREWLVAPEVIVSLHLLLRAKLFVTSALLTMIVLPVFALQDDSRGEATSM